MRVPIRKPGKYTHDQPDLHFTEAKFLELKKKLEKLIKVTRPEVATEVRRLAEMGDLSENAGYQIAKGRLRGINEKINELEKLVHHAIIIDPKKNTDIVEVGHVVTIEINGQLKTFTILGSSETNPSQGIISHNSPMGSALIGHRVGEKISFTSGERIIACKIVKIS